MENVGWHALSYSEGRETHGARRHAMKEVPDKGSSTYWSQNILPEKYHNKSTVEREIKAGENTFDFELN